MRKIIYVQPNESIAYLVDRMEHSEEKILYIVADANLELFTDALNMKLLRREMGALGENAVIVSQNRRVLDAAQNANIGVLEMSKEQLEEETGMGAFTVGGDDTPEAEEAVPVRVAPRDEYVPSVLRRSEKNEDADSQITFRQRYAPPEESEPKRGIAFSWKFILISFTVVAAAAGTFFWILTPRLSVSVTPKKETVRFDFQTVSDSGLSSVDTDKSRVPGKDIKIPQEVDGDFIASSKQNQETKAEGEVNIYNEYSSATQLLVKNTRLATADGKIFHLKNAATIPGASVKNGKVVAPGIVTAGVIADGAGPEYNIGPSRFTIPGFAGTPRFDGFYAQSSKSMAGGTVKGGFVATADDVAKAKDALTQKLTASLQDYINAHVPKGMVVLSGARSENVPKFSYNTPDTEGKFTAHLEVTYEAFAFLETDIATLVEDHLSKRLVGTEKADPSTRIISYADETLNAGKTVLTFTVKVNEVATGVIDAPQLATQLASKGENEIKEILKQNDAIESAEVTFWPFWISLAPANSGRITVTVQNGD